MSTESVECPSGLVITIRNMKAKEIALLADDGAEDEDEGGSKKPRAHSKQRAKIKRKNPITSILAGCTLEVNDVGSYPADWATKGVIATKDTPGPGRLSFPELLLCDRFYALMRVRATTWGDGYEFRVRCKDKLCAHFLKPFLWEIPISELATKDLPEASRKRLAAKDLVHSLTLGGKLAKFKLQQGLDEMNMPDLSAIPKREIFLAQCASRLIYVEGVDVTDFDALMEWVGELDMPEVVQATNLYDEVDGGVETNTMAQCPKCGLEFDVAVPFGATSFLLPDRPTQAGRPMAEPTV